MTPDWDDVMAKIAAAKEIDHLPKTMEKVLSETGVDGEYAYSRLVWADPGKYVIKESILKWKQSSNIEDLQKQLNKAVDEENYEQAAKIRDRINKLQRSGGDSGG